MTPERFQEVARLVGEALDLAPDDRAAFLAEACAGDPALRAEVESLLASSLAPGGWLDRDLLDWAAPLLQADPPEGLGGRRRGAGFLEGDALAGAAPLLEGETVAARGGAGRIGPYRLERLLGAGGMGEVWLAHDQRLDRSVALKLLDPDLAADPSSRRRFLREARLASALDHPHVCTIHEVGEADGVAFIAMQYLEGATIKELLADGPLPVSQWVPLALQVGEALAAAHARGIVHRDVKSSNVAVTTGGQAKVLDFGIAKRLADADAAEATQLTAVGSVLGTPGSMSPEQASGEAVDHRSDVFSLGVVMYEMATGDSPFVGFSRTEVLRAVVAHPHTPACERNPAVPAPLSRVIDRALAKTPGERYGAMRELLDDLRRAAGAAETDRGLEQRQRRRARIGIALAVALVVALSITSWLLRERGAAPPAIRSLAVLPFKPLVPQQSDEALELGMADTLIARLESLPELRVRPIGAVRRYAGQELDPVEVGRAQRTDAVLDGHIQKTSDAVRVTVRLVRVADGEALWSDRFDVPLADLFAVQDSISERVATALARRLSSEQRARLIQHSTDDPEAYRLYLLGRYHLTRMTDDGIWKGMTYFQQAVD
jgi:serine/threonine-protein kinase